MKNTIKAALFFTVLLIVHRLQAQWGAPFANSWIDYSKPYVRIGIQKSGLHSIAFSSLPKNFPVDDPGKFQLWRRGKQVSIISTANKVILFYAVPNDGASDSLLYRPMSARMNPYFSMYSDEGSYFLTVKNEPGSRARMVERLIDDKIPALTYHNERITTVFQHDFSMGTQYPILPNFLSSYFELGASRTGEVCKSGAELVVNFQLSNYENVSRKPTLRLLVHGRSNNSRKIEIYVGKSKTALRLAKTLDNSGFAGSECTFEIGQEDIDAQKSGTLLIKSVSSDRLERFSLAYYSLEYPQLISSPSQPAKELRLDPVKDEWSRLSRERLSSLKVFDITDIDNPVILKGTGDDIMVPRQPGKRQTLFVTSEIIEIAPAKIKETVFTLHDTKAANYIIITSMALWQGAKEYASYRASKDGGSFNPLIVEIQDVYNQFNYGEPSPVAIKKFMSYMLAGGVKDKYLFLIGKSITQNERMVRELPREVPTIGYPASDFLLVEGIAGTPMNIPAIPVGRLAALTNQNVLDYLDKVKAYESNKSGELGWRKRFLHLSGGKTKGEIEQLRDYLGELEPMVESGTVGGDVKAYVKQQASIEPEAVNITDDVNAGVGLITFFGHGSTVVADLDMGYATDVSRGYKNQNKYPVMYFNGCGVGNVFSGRSNPAPKNPKASDRIPLSLDWLIAPDRGAIAILANSFESFVSPGITYLETLYRHMFDKPENAFMPIGKIQLAVADDILSKYDDRYNIANVHQSLLQGDPALRLITVDKPDYAIERDEGITLLSGSAGKMIGESDSLHVSISLSNLGRLIEEETVPIKVTYLCKTEIHTKIISVKAFSSQLVLNISLYNEKGLRSIQVQIDPDQTIKELDKNNNTDELPIDWDLVKDKQMFSNKNIKDNIPPILSVKIDGRLPKRDEVIMPEPIINMLLSDDRVISLDTTLLELFVKHCDGEDCDFERIDYANGKLRMHSEDGELGFAHSTELGPGKYEMLINAKDRSGNAIVEPYRMRFEVVEPEELQHSLVLSPNPATTYMRFELKLSKLFPVRSVRYMIYNQWGMIIADKVLAVSDSSSTVEWYWLRANIGAGIYHYKVILTGPENEVFDIKTGKVAFLP